MSTLPFIGREHELELFRELYRKRTAALVTCQGRRRIGKSRFIQEGARQADHFLSFSGLPPRQGLGKADQLNAFSERLAAQTKAPKLPLESWPIAFQLLASQLPPSGSTVVLLDEISWMSIGDPDFPGHLKNAWDEHFSKRPHLIFVLCGSVSSWIQENILANTAFAGRAAPNFDLQPLPIRDCSLFWGRAHARISAAEKLRVLCVTGGIPRYLEEIDPGLTAEANIERLCFNPSGLLFNEFDQIFHDIFTRKAPTYRTIVKAMVPGPRTVDQISRAMRRERGGSLSDALAELESGGFIRKDAMFDPETGKSRPRDFRYRLSDNSLRFYLKYVEPEKERIAKGLFRHVPLETLTAWDTIAGLQFENLVFASLRSVLEQLGLTNVPVVDAGPYSQRKTQRREACQVDLLVRTRSAVWVVEMKFRHKTPKTVIGEVQEKVRRLKLPSNLSARAALIYLGELDSEIPSSDYFDRLIPAADLFQ